MWHTCGTLMPPNRKRFYSHHLDNHERDVCCKMLIDTHAHTGMDTSCNGRSRSGLRSLPLSRSFSHRKLMISLVNVLIRNSLHFEGKIKNKVEDSDTRGEPIFSAIGSPIFYTSPIDRPGVPHPVRSFSSSPPLNDFGLISPFMNNAGLVLLPPTTSPNGSAFRCYRCYL